MMEEMGKGRTLAAEKTAIFRMMEETGKGRTPVTEKTAIFRMMEETGKGRTPAAGKTAIFPEMEMMKGIFLEEGMTATYPGEETAEMIQTSLFLCCQARGLPGAYMVLTGRGWKA